MGRFFIFIYGIIAYAVGMGGLVWFILFVGSWDFLPLHIDSKTPGELNQALLINFAIILLFGVQHSVMARPSFKSKWTKIIPKSMERSTYVLITGLLMALFCLHWQAIEGTVWQVDNVIIQQVLIGLYMLGWVIVVLSSFLINHFELFGLQQVYCNLTKKAEPADSFTDRFFYKIVRHPLQFGVLMGVWATPHMTMTHLMLAVLLTIYIFIGLHYEEKDLVKSLGDKYENYQKQVPMLIPIPKSKQN
ncbi:MAG: hypothetical protein COA74_15700 [Gammaproteobacteria bacterium]|nr:MAG: hypothetical protein COA74_15700 [Gammaproteobacteria bacterium]